MANELAKQMSTIHLDEADSSIDKHDAKKVRKQILFVFCLFWI